MESIESWTFDAYNIPSLTSVEQFNTSRSFQTRNLYNNNETHIPSSIRYPKERFLAMADEKIHHPDSFLARFSRANNQLPAGKGVRRWLSDVEDPDEHVDDRAAIPSSDASEEEVMVKRLAYMLPVSSKDPLFHAHHQHFESQSNEGLLFDAEDLISVDEEGGGAALDEFDLKALADLELTIADKETSSSRYLPIIRYEGRTETYFPDGVQVDFDPVEFDEGVDGKENDGGVVSETTLTPESKKELRAKEENVETKAKKICDTKGHLFKSDYSIYCDNCGDNLDARRKYSCVADDCGVVFCPSCANQDEMRKPNVQYEKWLAENGAQIQRIRRV